MLLNPLDRLYKIWEQACDDSKAIKMVTEKDESVFYKGIKIQINAINIKIQSEVNQRNNKKHYDYLKLKRDNIINKYTKIIKQQKL